MSGEKQPWSTGCQQPNYAGTNYGHEQWQAQYGDLATVDDQYNYNTSQPYTGAPMTNIANDSSTATEDPIGISEFTEKSLRRGFIRKVFGILAAQLLVTFGIVAIFVLVDSVKKFAMDNMWVFYAAIIVTLVLVIALACGKNLRKQYPANIICLAIFTLAEAWLIGAAASTFDADEVLMATGICAGITVVMFLAGFQSKVDFTMCFGVLLALTLSLIGFGLLCAIVQDRYLNLMYASIGALVFSLWIAVDVQLVTGKGTYVLDSEEYILAALNIYLDIINLFLLILQLVGKNN